MIGRSVQSDIQIRDMQVSRKHAEIVYEHGHYTLCDLGSALGTVVNGKRIQKIVLRGDDEIQIGNSVLIFIQPE
jgi:pSer/pThr/pTyr-binding forkhead associated (FHA) protein